MKIAKRPQSRGFTSLDMGSLCLVLRYCADEKGAHSLLVLGLVFYAFALFVEIFLGLLDRS